MPNYSYSFETGPVRFHAINTNCHLNAWYRLYQSFDEHSMDNSGKPWNIVFGHHPIYSQGSHGDTDLVQQFIWNILFEQEVDFYLSGHDHHLNALRKGDSGPYYLVSGAEEPTIVIERTSRTFQLQMPNRSLFIGIPDFFGWKFMKHRPHFDFMTKQGIFFMKNNLNNRIDHHETQAFFFHSNGFPARTYGHFLKLLKPGIQKPSIFSVLICHLLEGPWILWLRKSSARLPLRKETRLESAIHWGSLCILAQASQPNLFQNMILLDPPIFSPLKRSAIRWLRRLGILEWFSPSRRVRRRRNTFASRTKPWSILQPNLYFRTFPNPHLNFILKKDCHLLKTDSNYASQERGSRNL